MPRYVAFLRGVSPMNCSMAALRGCLEDLGFENVKTVRSSGNAVFDARKSATGALERRIEAKLAAGVGRSFGTFVRSRDELASMLEADAFAAHKLPAAAKRLVTFLHEPPEQPPGLPIVIDGAWIVACAGREVFAAYEPGHTGPEFMKLLEDSFGKNITTRTWDTVRKCVAA